MVLRRLWAVALAAQCVSAFKDTSPFFLFSTSRLSSQAAQPNLISSSSLSGQVSDALSSCPSDTYIIISQPGVHALDYSAKHASPNLRQYLNNTAPVVESWVISEVVGTLDTKGIERSIQDKCKADVLRIDATTGTIPNDGVYPRIVYVQFPSLPPKPQARSAKLAEYDSFLHAVISEVGNSKYTVIYTTTPPASDYVAVDQGSDEYEMEDRFGGVLHTDLKRDLSGHTLKSNGTDLPLFDRYEYLSPGVFMGLFVFLLLLMILYVGITAVASLQVSYFAFSKEMGPSQQKKQQ